MPDLVVISMCLTCFIGAIPYITQVQQQLNTTKATSINSTFYLGYFRVEFT